MKNVGDDNGATRTLIIASWSITWYNHFGRQLGSLIKN